MRTAKTLIRLGGCPDWSESSLGAHAILLVLTCGGSFRKKKHTHTHTHIVNCRSIARQELVRPSEEYVSGLMKELLFRQWKRNRKAMTSVLLQLAVFATKITLMHYFCIHVCNGQTLSRQRLAIERSRQHVMDHSNNDIKTSQTSWHFLTWC